VINAYNEFVERLLTPCQARYAPLILINMFLFLVSMLCMRMDASSTQTDTDEC
jgi:hypothetical protein